MDLDFWDCFDRQNPILQLKYPSMIDIFVVPYFSVYKMDFFPSKRVQKNLDPSYKMDPDLWNCLGRVKLVFYQNFIGLICFHSRERGKPHLIAE